LCKERNTQKYGTDCKGNGRIGVILDVITYVIARQMLVALNPLEQLVNKGGKTLNPLEQLVNQC